MGSAFTASLFNPDSSPGSRDISVERLEGEAALTTLAYALDIHPKLRGFNIAEEGRGIGHRTMLLQRRIGVKKWLEDDVGTEDEGKRVSDDLCACYA